MPSHIRGMGFGVVRGLLQYLHAAPARFGFFSFLRCLHRTPEAPDLKLRSVPVLDLADLAESPLSLAALLRTLLPAFTMTGERSPPSRKTAARHFESLAKMAVRCDGSDYVCRVCTHSLLTSARMLVNARKPSKCS